MPTSVPAHPATRHPRAARPATSAAAKPKSATRGAHNPFTARHLAAELLLTPEQIFCNHINELLQLKLQPSEIFKPDGALKKRCFADKTLNSFIRMVFHEKSILKDTTLKKVLPLLLRAKHYNQTILEIAKSHQVNWKIIQAIKDSMVVALKIQRP